MPSTRSRTSTEAPEVAVEDKKTEVSEQQPENESEVKETPTEDKAEESNSAEQSSDSTSADEKQVDKSEDNTNGSTTTTDALPSDTNGDQTDDKPENGSAKRKSTTEEAGDAPDSTDITPKKVKVDDESNGTKDSGAGDETDKQTAVETTA